VSFVNANCPSAGAVIAASRAAVLANTKTPCIKYPLTSAADSTSPELKVLNPNPAAICILL
jgi:hypothetical protein